jgi:hypothetical protein
MDTETVNVETTSVMSKDADQVNLGDEDSTKDVNPEVAEDTESKEITLTPEVLEALRRRGGRRLRDIQSSSQASLKLDRVRGVLDVTGTKASIADVLRQLDGVNGPCVKVAGPVWSELMRTRTNTDPTQSAVARIQRQSGVRIHIERTSLEIRLFGPNSKVAVGQQLMSVLDAACVEEGVEMESPASLDSETLQSFANEFGISCIVEEKQIMILGIKGAVIEAATELRTYEADKARFEQARQATKPNDVCRSAIEGLMTQLKMEAAKISTDENISCESTTIDSLPSFEKDDSFVPSENQMQGIVIAKLPPADLQRPDKKKQTSSDSAKPSFSACPDCGDSGNFCVHCGQPQKKMVSGFGACRRCGASNFCVFCGQPTLKKQLEDKKKKQASTTPTQDSGMTKARNNQMMMQGMHPSMMAMYIPAGQMNQMNQMNQMPFPQGYQMPGARLNEYCYDV